MVIVPRVRGFICTVAHPLGCAQHVQEQIDYVQKQPRLLRAPKRVLIIGASTGYGLASRITAAFGADAQTIGVSFERPAEGKRTASAGWYNTAAFEHAALSAGLYAKSINGDAFSDAIKAEACALIQKDWGQVDLIIYSLASPRRVHPTTGAVSASVLKTVGKPFKNKTVDAMTGQISEIEIEPATPEEIQATCEVMGGEDWQLWIEALMQQDLIAPGAMTVAYSYIGPELTYPIYKNGTIGKAKDHLLQTAHGLDKKMQALGGRALVSINKAVVTQASAAIPIVPLYLAILFKVMKAKHTHEDCIQQIYRLFSVCLYQEDGAKIPVDAEGRIRLDDLEMRADVQSAIAEIWPKVTTETVNEITDLAGYRHAFYQLFGFEFSEVNYAEDVDPHVRIPSVALE